MKIRFNGREYLLAHIQTTFPYNKENYLGGAQEVYMDGLPTGVGVVIPTQDIIVNIRNQRLGVNRDIKIQQAQISFMFDAADDHFGFGEDDTEITINDQ